MTAIQTAPENSVRGTHRHYLIVEHIDGVGQKFMDSSSILDELSKEAYVVPDLPLELHLQNHVAGFVFLAAAALVRVSLLQETREQRRLHDYVLMFTQRTHQLTALRRAF